MSEMYWKAITIRLRQLLEKESIKLVKGEKDIENHNLIRHWFLEKAMSLHL